MGIYKAIQFNTTTNLCDVTLMFDPSLIFPNETYVAGENIAANAVVTLVDIAGTTTVFNANAQVTGSPAAAKRAIGFVLSAVTTGNQVAVYFGGTFVVSAFGSPPVAYSAANVGQLVFQDIYPGAITVNPPSLPNLVESVGAIIAVDGSGNATISFFTSAVGAGEVTFVGLTLPADTFSVTGSPITGAGTLVGSHINQAAHAFHAGPASGGAGPTSWRAIAIADLFSADGVTTTHFLSEAGTWLPGSAAGAPAHLAFNHAIPDIVLATSANNNTEFDFGGSQDPNVLDAVILPDPTTGAAALCRVQDALSTSPTSTPQTSVFTDLVGSTLLLIFIWEGPATVTSVTDAEGNIWTSAHAAVAGTGTLSTWFCQTWKTSGILGGTSNQITVHMSASTSNWIPQVSEYVKTGSVNTCVIGSGNVIGTGSTTSLSGSATGLSLTSTFFYAPPSAGPWLVLFELGCIQRAAMEGPFIYQLDTVFVGSGAYSSGGATAPITTDYFAMTVSFPITGSTVATPSVWNVVNNSTSSGINPASSYVLVNDYNQAGVKSYTVRSGAYLANNTGGSFHGRDGATLSTDGVHNYALITDSGFEQGITVLQDYIVQPWDDSVRVDSASPTTIYLQNQQIPDGKVYRIKNVGTGIVTVIPLSPGINIDGNPTYTLSSMNAGDFEYDADVVHGEITAAWWVF